MDRRQHEQIGVYSREIDFTIRLFSKVSEKQPLCATIPFTKWMKKINGLVQVSSLPNKLLPW